jgi:hypothetical protein
MPPEKPILHKTEFSSSRRYDGGRSLERVWVDGDLVRWRFRYGAGPNDWGTGARLMSKGERARWLIFRRTPRP